MLLETPFHPRTRDLCLSHEWRRWAGFLAASKYDLTHEREYHAIRNAVALIDVSPLYKYHIQGPDAGRLLNRVMTRDVSRCAVGQAQYTVWCNDRGQVFEDGMLARLDEDLYRVTAAEPNLRWFQDNALGLAVDIRDMTTAIGALAVQGPLSRNLLKELTDGAVSGLRYFRLKPAQLAGRPVIISRTGYTGDLGYEIWVAADEAVAVWDALVRQGGDYGLVPAGMLALDLARIEAGYILADVDYIPVNKTVIPEQRSTPYELNLGWLVGLDKPDYFVGRRALEAEFETGPAWQLVGLEIDWDSLESAYAAVGLPAQVPALAWRVSAPVYQGRREAGYASSGCFSPLLKRYIALASLRREFAYPGAELEMEITVEHMRRRAIARVVPTPFFDPERKRKTED